MDRNLSRFKGVLLSIGGALFSTNILAGIVLSSSQLEVNTGSTVDFSIKYEQDATTLSSPVDVYVAAMAPGSSQLFFFPDFSTQPNACINGWSPVNVGPVNFFSHTFEQPAQFGEYKIYAALSHAGMMVTAENAIIGLVAETSVVYQDDSVTPSSLIEDVTPKNGDTVSITPRFSIVFSQPVGNATSLLAKSQIVVKSLSSGKTATLNPADSSGERMAQLYLPDDGMTVTYKVGESEASLVSPIESSDGMTLSLDIVPITLYGQTFQLSSGGQYSFSIAFQDDAVLEDGTSLSGVTVGPIEFTVE